MDPTNPSQAWVALSGFGAGHVFFTNDFGAHWADETGNLPDTPASSLAIDTRSPTPVLYVGTDVGVFRSTNSGTSWAVFGTGLPHSVVTDLVLNSAYDTLAAATHGRGMFVAGL